jgi:hypothetical protein
MECPGDLAWICLSFPALLPAIIALFQAGSVEVEVHHSRWQTSYGVLEMATVERSLVARYPDHAGVVLGWIDERGRMVEGTWLQPRSDRACPVAPRGISADEIELLGASGIDWPSRHWGTLSFRIAENGAAFKGQWPYCDLSAVSGGAWDGKRISHETRRVRLN